MSKKNQRAPGRIAPSNVTALLEEGMRSQRAGDLEAAERCYQRVLLKQAGHPDALHLLGVIARSRGDLEGAVRSIREAIQRAPNVPIYHVNLGRVLGEQGDLDGSISALERAVSLDGTLLAAVFNLGLAYEEKGDLDEAASHYGWAAEALPEAAFNLGNLLIARGLIDDGVKAYEQAIALRADYARAWANLGYAHQKAGRFDAAADTYRKLLNINPGDAEATHMLAALTGATLDRADPSYVARFFDDYAARFETVLLKDLAYDTPAALAALVARFAPASGSFKQAIDLGCGTGLAGRALRPLCEHLSGVDLSPNMIEKARLAGGYDVLRVDDLLSFLSDESLGFDLAVASDVFNYLGDLEPTLRLLRARALPGAVIAFSTEQGEKGAFQLERTGRFCHSSAYVLAAAHKVGLDLRLREEKTLRLERGVPVLGNLFVLAVS